MQPKRRKGGRRRATPSRKRRSGKRNSGAEWWVVAGLVLVLLLTLSAGGLLQRLLSRRALVPGQISGMIRGLVHSAHVTLTPTFEIYPEETEPDLPEPPKPAPTPEPIKPGPPKPKPIRPEPAPETHQGHRPRIAIVIDDLGYDLSMARKFIDLGVPISLAILPHSPFQGEISQKARAAGLDILLHLPMEPMGYPEISPGPGALLAEMSPEALSAELLKDLHAIEGIRGVNNHMGSRLTTLPESLAVVFAELKKRRLFFLDSRTSPASCAASVALRMALPFASRNIFLDHTATADTTRAQLQKLLAIARRNGSAIGIGHPHASTHAELVRALPALKNQAILVPVSQLVSIPAG